MSSNRLSSFTPTSRPRSVGQRPHSFHAALVRSPPPPPPSPEAQADPEATPAPVRDVVAYVPLGGFGPFDAAPAETERVVRHREAAFVAEWKAYLAGRRRVWAGVHLTPADEMLDSARRQVAVQTRHDMNLDHPWSADFPPHSVKMYRLWREKHWDAVLADEIDARLDARRGSVAAGDGRNRLSTDGAVDSRPARKRVVSMPVRPRDRTLLFEDAVPGLPDDDDDGRV